jgi:ribosome-associated protein
VINSPTTCMGSKRFHLPENELTWRFSRSSGPGGQHVNTTDTRVELVWSLRDTHSLSDTQRDLVARQLRNRVVNGEIAISSSEYRSQHRNREAARVRLEELVAKALIPPKARHATKPSKAARQRRIDNKKRRGDLKRGRGGDWN